MFVNELSRIEFSKIGPGTYAPRDLDSGVAATMRNAGRNAYCPTAPIDLLGPEMGPAKYDLNKNFDNFYHSRRITQANRSANRSVAALHLLLSLSAASLAASICCLSLYSASACH